MVKIKYGIILILILIPFLNSAFSTEFTLLHYNIKELTSKKLRHKNKQLKAVSHLLKKKKFDLLSLNEIQYDQLGVPNLTYQSSGENLHKLAAYLGLKGEWYEAFYPANTGNNAKPFADGTFPFAESDPKADPKLADPVNYGLFPGEYSTAALVKFKILKKKILSNLRWLDFNPKRDLSKYLDDHQLPLKKDIFLFDKNFTDLTLSFAGKEFHLILLHTVPAYGFNNKKSMNYARNEDQLRFLEWYLTGHTDIKVSADIKTLAGKEPYIAVGDWNTDVNKLEDPGAYVLARLIRKAQLWYGPTITYESPGYDKTGFFGQLDYIIFSKHFELSEAGVLRPDPKREELGCEGEKRSFKRLKKSEIIVNYKKSDRICYAKVSRDYKSAKDASDHYPVWAKFKWAKTSARK